MQETTVRALPVKKTSLPLAERSGKGKESFTVCVTITQENLWAVERELWYDVNGNLYAWLWTSMARESHLSHLQPYMSPIIRSDRKHIQYISAIYFTSSLISFPIAISHEFVSFSQEWLECVPHGGFLGTWSWQLSYVLALLWPSGPGRVNIPEGWQSRSGSAWRGQREKGGTVSKRRPCSCLPTSSSSSAPS